MAKKYILELTQKELEFVRDGVEFLDPDNDKARRLQANLLARIENTPAKKPVEIFVTLDQGMVSAVACSDENAEVKVIEFFQDQTEGEEKINRALMDKVSARTEKGELFARY